MRLRPESSVSPDRDEYGQLYFPGVGHGAVIHRTPEELGLARVVPDDTPGKLMPWINRDAVIRVRRARGLPASPTAAEEKFEELKEEESEVEQKKITDEQVEAIKAAPSERAKDLAARLGIAEYHVYYYRAKQREEPGAGARPLKAHKKPTAIVKASKPVEPVEMRRKGADSLINVLGKVDGQGGVKVELALSHAEVAQVLAGLDPVQRTAFLSAGLRAALLA